MKKLLFAILMMALLLCESVFADYDCSQYGLWSYAGSDGYCYCDSGYRMGKLGGYNYCVSNQSYCTNTYGFNATYSSLSNSCVCDNGYHAITNSFGDQDCISNDEYCTRTFGNNAKYSEQADSCVCKDGYTSKKDYAGNITCEQKAYSTFAVLQEYKDGDAIVSYMTPYGSLERAKISMYNCYGIEDYVGNNVVLNLMYDQILDSGDYLILPNTYKTVCNIYNVDNGISDDDSLYTCKDIFGSNSISTGNRKCGCDTGYEWSADGKSCIPTYYFPTSIPKRLYCKTGELRIGGKCRTNKKKVSTI